MIPLNPKKREKKKSIKTFHSCFICKQQKGFTWSCDCGFAFCTDCLDEAKRISVIGVSNWDWDCPDCGHQHKFAKG
jgi:hypothetical protein